MHWYNPKHKKLLTDMYKFHQVSCNLNGRTGCWRSRVRQGCRPISWPRYPSGDLLIQQLILGTYFTVYFWILMKKGPEETLSVCLQRFLNRTKPPLSKDQQQNLTRWAVSYPSCHSELSETKTYERHVGLIWSIFFFGLTGPDCCLASEEQQSSSWCSRVRDVAEGHSAGMHRSNRERLLITM
jgi:hypothetical protein